MKRLGLGDDDFFASHSHMHQKDVDNNAELGVRRFLAVVGVLTNEQRVNIGKNYVNYSSLAALKAKSCACIFPNRLLWPGIYKIWTHILALSRQISAIN